MSDKQQNPLYRAQALLARRDHSEYELAQKLKQRGFTASQIALAVQKLKSLCLLDDEKFADAFTGQILMLKPVGPRYINHKLRQKKIADIIISAVITKHFPPEREKKLARQAAGRWRHTHARQAADKIRLHRYLAARGFSSAAINSALE